MNEYVTVILSRNEAIDLCRAIETTRAVSLLANETHETFERVYSKIMKDLANETGEVTDVR